MIKLPVKPIFLFAVAFLYLMTSCKKESSVDLIPTPSPDGKGIQVRLTSEEQALLADLISKEGVKDSVDFLNKISYVKSKSNSQKSSRLTANSAITAANSDEGSEEISIADFYSNTSQEMSQYDPDYYHIAPLLPQYPTSTVKGYKNVGIRYTYFVVRGNQVMFSVPHVVGLKASSFGAEVIKVDAMPSSPPSIQPVGPYWGTYTASQSPAYVQGISNHSANVHAQGTEVRTEVRSVQGNIKISTEADLALFQVGTEMGAGFTIQSANNIYNQYVLNGTFSIQLLSPPGLNGEPPMFNFASSLTCTQHGILRNQ